MRTGIVVFLFISAAFLVFSKPESTVSVKPAQLNQALKNMGTWTAGEHIPYDKAIVDSLALDDYVNKTFIKNNNAISLYVGYYTTAKKVGAAHDPLVCFPGQGWQISDRQTGTMKIPPPVGQEIKYSTMRVDRNENSTLILYWFQAGEITNSNTFAQKLTTFYNQIRRKKEDNAFVRLTCALKENSETDCLQNMQDFIHSFYPIFLQYIRE